MIRLLIILFIPFFTYASHIPISQIAVCDENRVLYKDKDKCVEVSSEDCLKIDSSYNCEYSQYNERQVDGEPIEECTEVTETDAEGNEVVVGETCVITGYEQITIKEIIEDPVKKAAYETEEAAKEAEKAAKKADYDTLLEKLKTEDLKIDEVNTLLRSLYL